MDWSTVFAVVGGGLAAVLASTFGGLKKTIDSLFDRLNRKISGGRGRGSPIDRLSFLAEFNSLTNYAKKLRTVDRCLVFVGHNCGGLPKPGERYTVKSQTGWANNGDDVYRRFDFEIVIDEPYAEMLLSAHHHGVVVMDVETMPDGLLKGIYRQEGVKQSVLYSLGHDPDRNEFAYCTFASYGGPISLEDRNALSLLVSRLRALLAEDTRP